MNCWTPLPKALVAILLVFGALTAWAVTVTGVFESASLDVEHFDAGAGNLLLLLRSGLAWAASGIAILWALRRGTVAVRLKRLAVMPAVLLIYFFSITSLNRFAPSYSEEKFLQVVAEHQKGHSLTQKDVMARLGRPLMTASRPEGSEVWSYTYTPSGGFGWKKRLFTFDSRGVLAEIVNFAEP